ncbi:Nuclear transcription factor Y subunit C-2 [Camellia lanceoleosa]|uniref:Nuclear transcription factor Y subunit C-2 n=1 Tax=Camellia lanceoleosa TaxID=1840588 RepID=A0ACC0GYU6_9ERIC|nr:Nuclear transcription factor Y subunit C-2 [Camellia lanceoleosa]
MDQPEQTQHQLPFVGVVAGSGQMAYASPPYHMVAPGSSTVAVHSPTEPPATFSTSQHQLAYQQAQNNSNFKTDVFDFLVDIIPRDELEEEGLGVTKASIPMVGSSADSIPYYYVPPQHPVGPTGIIMGKPVD